MKSFLKIFTIFTPSELRRCAIIVAAMVVGAMLEAVGIGAILPLISLMGQPDFLERHAEIQSYAAGMGIEGHRDLIMAGALALIFLYAIKISTWPGRRSFRSIFRCGTRSIFRDS